MNEQQQPQVSSCVCCGTGMTAVIYVYRHKVAHIVTEKDSSCLQLSPSKRHNATTTTTITFLIYSSSTLQNERPAITEAMSLGEITKKIS